MLKNQVLHFLHGAKKRPEFFLAIAIFVYTLVFSYITILRHYSFNSTYFDLGCFEQGLWTTLEGSFFWNSPHNASQFGVHNSPILFLLLPIYKLFPFSETLLITQTILLALAAIPLYYIGKKYLDSWGGLVFSIIYLLYPALHGINLFDFHELAFLPLILFLSLYYLITNQIRGFVITSLIALMIKEDVSLLLIALTAYAIYSHRYSSKQQKWVMYILIFIYISWLLISFQYIIPYFNPQGYAFSSRYDTTGGISDILTHNFLYKLVYIFLLLIPLGFTPIAAPDILLVLTPSLAEILLQSNVAYRITTQYSALLIPVLFVSAIIGTQRVSKKMSDIKPRFSRYILPGLLLLGILSFLLCTPAPVSPWTLYYKFSPNQCQYNIDEHAQLLKDVIDSIPPDASISTQNNLASHLSKRFNIYITYQQDVDYILMDEKTVDVEWIENHKIIFPINQYNQIFSHDGINLYKLKKQWMILNH